ncbi:MAG TPA: fructose-bisphosphatase class II [Verrucomicrobiae bacterium]|nr:fructose-bisphosphatase class II [Verrucomicrobiae bacterium]
MNLPGFYARKLAFGPGVLKAMREGMEPVCLNAPLEKTLPKVADALGKRLPELVVVMLNRPRHAELIAAVRRSGAALRLITDGDVTAAVSPSMPDSGVDLYCGIGDSPEAVPAAAALKALGGEPEISAPFVPERKSRVGAHSGREFA